MNRSIRRLARCVLALVVLLTLTGPLTQPATLSRAQESTPPSPTPTPVLADSSQEVPSSSGLATAIINPDGSITYQPPHSAQQPAAAPEEPATPVEPAAPAPVADTVVETPQAQVSPQAETPLTPFLVNIVSAATARAGTDLTYTIYFTNTGSTTYNNVLLQDSIGDSQAYLNCDSGSPSTCPWTYTGDQPAPVLTTVTGNSGDWGGRQLTWSLGTVPPGKKGRITYTVRIRHDVYPRSGAGTKVLGNTVVLYKDGQPGSANKLNQDEGGTVIVGPVFYISKVSTPSAVLQGDTVTFELTVGNATGPEDKPDGKVRSDARTATNVDVVDVISNKLDTITPLDGGTFDPSTRWLTWKIAKLDPDTSVKLRFTAKIRSDNDFNECNDLVNRGYATSNEVPLTSEGQRQYVEGQVESRSNIYAPAGLSMGRSPNNILVGGTATWTIVASNFWRSALSGVGISWYLPPNFTYMSSNPPGVYDATNRKVVWSNLTIPNKASFASPGQIQLSVTAQSGRTIGGHEATTFFSTLPAGVPTGCLRDAREGVNVEPLLTADKGVDVTKAVLAGTNVIYTVNLYNLHSQPMNDVTLLDVLPRLSDRPFIFQQMVSGGGPAPTSLNPTNPQFGQQQQVRWENLSIPAGSPTNPGKITLRFIVRADGRPDDCSNNIVFPDSSISQARETHGGHVCIAFPWGVTKTVNRSTVNPRDSNRLVEFTLKYVNNTTTSVNMEPKDRFLSPFTFKRMMVGPDGTTKPNPSGPINGVLTWPLITLGPEQTVYYKFEAELPASNGVIPTGDYCNRGELWPVGEDYYIYTRPDACVRVTSIELEFKKEIDGRDVIGLGELVTYRLVLENRSDDTVRGLVVSDTLPVNMTYIAPVTGSPAPQVTKLPNGQQRLRWEGLDVQANTRREIKFSVRAPALIGIVTNDAEITGGNPLPAFRCDLVTQAGCIARRNLDVRGLISIGPEVTPAITDPNTVVSYTLTLASNNNIPYQNVVMTTTLPVGFTFIKMISGPTPSQPRPGVLIWSGQKVPELGAPEKGRLTLKFQARTVQGYGSFTSRFDASSTTGVIPTVDNSARVLIAPKTPALSLSAPSLAEPGSEVKIKVSLVNPEAQDVTNVAVNTQLPDGFAFKRVDDGTAAPTVSGQKLTWSNLTMKAATNGVPGVVEIIFYVTAPTKLGTYTVTATATGSKTIDQTYNNAKIVVANLRYTYLAIIRR